MLKCLQLIGFKSFADKTRIEFDSGITAIVGPNGSGKSNVVDAMRWILGEQSAKSLRGKEMADVIFNGSSTRRSLGMAEVSLFLDNRKGYLPVEAEEVVITRRVYRSGEGEYLINGRVSRLKDIRNMFLGTGAGTNAYSIIEQGKVDQMLQASTKDRRHIFEEAAGTSRFKSKKIEALRRLERVDSNLVRVLDINEEVQKNLRGLRNQAGKARKYKEYFDRLKEVRLTLGLNDLSKLAGELNTLEEKAGTLGSRLEVARNELAAAQARFQSVDTDLTAKEETQRQTMEEVSASRERISALESEIGSDERRLSELEEQIRSGRRETFELRLRVRELSESCRVLDADYQKQQTEHREQSGELAEKKKLLGELDQQRDQARTEVEQQQRRIQELLRQVARLENEQSGLEGQLSLLWQQRERLKQKEHQLQQRAGSLGLQQAQFAQQLAGVVQQRRRVSIHSSSTRDEHRQLLEQSSQVQSRLSELREQRTALVSRIDVLKGLQNEHEGLEGGVKRILAEREKAREEAANASDGEDSPVPRSSWECVVGVLAELLEAPSEYADLVELALGPMAQAVVIDSQEAMNADLMTAAQKLPGRVQFVSLRPPLADRLVIYSEEISGPSLASVISCDQRFRPLIEALLGTTFVADDYESAQELCAESVDLRFITRSGELIDPTGVVAAGPRRSGAGILSRAAAIRDLTQQIAELEASIAREETQLSEVRQRITAKEATLGHQELLAATLDEQVRHSERVLDRLRQETRTVSQQLSALESESENSVREIRQAEETARRHEADLANNHQLIKESNESVAVLQDRQVECEAARVRHLEEVQQGSVRLATLEERRLGLEHQRSRTAVDLQQRQKDLDESQRRIESFENREREVSRRLLSLRADLALAYADKDRIAVQDGGDPALIQALRHERRQLLEASNKLRSETEQGQKQLHEGELRLTELRMNRSTLLERIREDYQIELETMLDAEVEFPPAEVLDEMRTESKDLKDKLQRLGSVNLQAIEELDELEQRATTLQVQIDDLTTAKSHLEQVIEKINVESRRMFLESFETIRTHFQELFRKLFGGGKADLLLEDEADPLDSGIEIIARPPGKEPRSISLLSGGEKTMTAVALLMAIFQSKPSPFCILDEVDAALDEANIVRFTHVLREFLTLSQFVIITHAKTTMSTADVLHGITQREAGVSTRISVRLEDVSEDGNIHEESAQTN